MTSIGKDISRLDKELVSRGLVQSRTRAQALISLGGVTVNDIVVTNANTSVGSTDRITLIISDIPWVSRAGLKLEHALTHWHVDPKGKTVLDIGASTGGFTDVLIAFGAAKVYALDVGQGQLAEKLRHDARVVNMEQTHINNVSSEDFPLGLDMVVIDVSFISLEKVLPKVKELMNEGLLIALIKPQFEVGREHINKGIVKSDELHEKVLSRIEGEVARLGFTLLGIIPSPILGGDGNKEFLLCAQLSSVHS